MPYIKKTRKRTYRKKAYKKPFRYEVADMALNAWKGVKQIKQLINVEIKKHDTLINAGVTTTGSVFSLSDIPQGDGYNQRDGISVKPQYLVGRFYIQNDPSHVSTTAMRVMLIRGINENGVTPGVTTILESADVWSLRNFVEKSKVTVMMDRTINITPYKNGEVKFTQLEFKMPVNKHIHFETSGTNKENGGLYMLCISNRGTLFPVIHGNARLTFTDN